MAPDLIEQMKITVSSFDCVNLSTSESFVGPTDIRLQKTSSLFNDSSVVLRLPLISVRILRI